MGSPEIEAKMVRAGQLLANAAERGDKQAINMYSNLVLGYPQFFPGQRDQGIYWLRKTIALDYKWLEMTAALLVQDKITYQEVFFFNPRYRSILAAQNLSDNCTKVCQKTWALIITKPLCVFTKPNVSTMLPFY
jgi:glutathionylspermidine synthase